MIRKLLSLTLAVTLALSMGALTGMTAFAAYNGGGFNVVQKGSSLTVSWSEVSGADGYLVYATYCGKKYGSNVRDVKGASSLSLTIKRINGRALKTRKNFHVCVKAYQELDGERTVIASTVTAHVAGAKNRTRTNAKSVKLLSAGSLELNKGDISQVKARTVLARSGKKRLPSTHCRALRYFSSDEEVAEVDRSGLIRAIGEGSCYVSVVAMNGCSARIQVTVAGDPADSPAFSGGVSEAQVDLREGYDASEDPKFGAAVVAVDPEVFNQSGFALGDSVDIVFSNGYTLTDVPYYNGYYVKTGAPVMVAYPGNDYLLITLNNKGIWEEADLTDSDTVEIKLNTKAKYLAIQEALGQSYDFVKRDDQTSEEFANFRPLSGGSLKEGVLYRGASPVDNSRGRAAYADALIQANGVNFVMDLADSAADVEGYISGDGFDSDYARELYEEGNFALLAMGSNYESAVYKSKVAEGLKQMTAAGGPAYIHCMEGKDRTGFVCMLVEALAGASYDEMLSDYMITYRNYYGITEAQTPDKYNAVADLYFNTFMEYLHGSSDISQLKTADYANDARNYLRDGGMTDDEIDAFLEMVTE